MIACPNHLENTETQPRYRNNFSFNLCRKKRTQKKVQPPSLVQSTWLQGRRIPSITSSQNPPSKHEKMSFPALNSLSAVLMVWYCHITRTSRHPLPHPRLQVFFFVSLALSALRPVCPPSSPSTSSVPVLRVSKLYSRSCRV